MNSPSYILFHNYLTLMKLIATNYSWVTNFFPA